MTPPATVEAVLSHGEAMLNLTCPVASCRWDYEQMCGVVELALLVELAQAHQDEAHPQRGVEYRTVGPIDTVGLHAIDPR